MSPSISMAMPNTTSAVPRRSSQLNPGPSPVKARRPEDALTTEALVVPPEPDAAVAPPLDVDPDPPEALAGS